MIDHRYVCRPDEAKQIASKMLGHRLYTKQTGREGKPVNKLIMCEKLFTRREYYFACKDLLVGNFSNICLLVALERRFGGPVIITSTQGGTNIEEIAADNPDAIIHHPIDIATGLVREDALKIAERLGFRNEGLQEVRSFPFFPSTLLQPFPRRLIP